jgi:NADH-quinone oxidoreductase subunit C
VTELSSKNAALAKALDAKFGAKLTRQANTHGEISCELGIADFLETALVLRNDEAFKFELLMDLCGVDYLSYGRAEWDTSSATSTGFSRGVHRGQVGLGEQLADTAYQPAGRFAVVYHLLSVTHNQRLRLKVFCDKDERPMADSVVSVWSSACWYEREAFDLFGIVFVGNPDLRRILTDYGNRYDPDLKDDSNA